MTDYGLSLAFAAAFLIAVFAVAIQSGAGIGFGLLFVPPLTLLIDPKLVVPLSLVFGGLAAGYVAIRSRRDLVGEALRPILVSGLVGIVVGTYLLFALPTPVIRLAIGFFVLVFGIPLALGKTWRLPQLRAVAVAAGFVSGFVNGTVGMGGPPVVMLMLNQGYDNRAIRATLSAYYSLSAALAIALAVGGGQLDAQIVPIGLSLGAAIPFGLLAGGFLFTRMSPARFRYVLLAILLVSGVVGLATGISGLIEPA